MGKKKKDSKKGKGSDRPNTIIRGSGGRKVKTSNGKFISIQLNLDHLIKLVEELGDEYTKDVKFKDSKKKERLVEINMSPSKFENQDYYMALKPVFVPKRMDDGSPKSKK